MVKFQLGANKLRFPSGVTVEQAKKDARKLSKSLNISRSQALDQTAKQNGLGMAWGQAIACLKSGRLPLATYHLPLREESVNHLVSIFEDRPLITITGPAGSGKSVLALDIARQHLEQQTGKVYYVSWGEVDFSKESPPEFLLQDLAYSLGRNLCSKFKSRFVSLIFSFGSEYTDNSLPALQEGDLVVLDEAGYLLSINYPVEKIVKQDKAVVLMTSQNEDGYGPIASEKGRVGCMFMAKQIGRPPEILNKLPDQKTASSLWNFLKSLEIVRGVHSEMCAMTPDPLWVDIVRLRQENLIETVTMQNPEYQMNVECLKDISSEGAEAILANAKTKMFLSLSDDGPYFSAEELKKHYQFVGTSSPNKTLPQSDRERLLSLQDQNYFQISEDDKSFLHDFMFFHRKYGLTIFIENLAKAEDLLSASSHEEAEQIKKDAGSIIRIAFPSGN